MPDAESAARDRAWVEAVRAGDALAFAELYRAHGPAMRTIASSYVRDRDAVDDIVQETFTKALQRIDDLHAPDRFRAWLSTIARNCAADFLRRRTLEGPTESEYGLPDRPGSDLGPEQLAELDELTRLVDGSVVGLTARDATAVMMMTGLGFSSSDVADALAITPGAAKVVAHRARHRLRQSLSMQLLVRIRGSQCDEFRRLLDGGDPVAAARHLARCPACRDAARAEINLYELETDDADALGPQRVHERAGHRVGSPVDQTET